MTTHEMLTVLWWIIGLGLGLFLTYVSVVIGCCMLAARGFRQRVERKEIYLSIDEAMAHRNPLAAALFATKRSDDDSG